METEAVSCKYSTSGYSRLPVLVSAVMLFANEVIMNVLTQAGLQEGGVLAGDRWRASLLMSAVIIILQYIHRDVFRWCFPLLQVFCWMMVPVAWAWVIRRQLHWPVRVNYSGRLWTIS